MDELNPEPFDQDQMQPVHVVEMTEVQDPPVRSKAERAGFPDWLLAYGWIIIAFIMFQVIAAVVIIVGLIGKPGVDLATLMTPEGLANHYDLMFLGNSLGQIIAFGLLTLPLVYFVKRRSWSEMLPFKSDANVWKMALLASVGVMVAAPTVWFLAFLNMQIPLPEALVEIERQQTELIEGFLKSDFNIVLALFHVAMVPAICEEILYRGFVLNLLRRTKAIWTTILITGIIFGFYHLRLSQVIPLAVIGIFLGWITIKSGSLIPAMIAHFVNNAFSVLLVRLMPESPLASSVPEMPPLWLVAGSIALIYVVLYTIRRVTNSEGEAYVWKPG
jgi:uncharacterized protein